MLTSPAKVQESHALCNPRSPKVSKKSWVSGITLTFFPLTKTCWRSPRRHQLFYRTSFSFRVTGYIINGEGQFLPLSNIDLLLFLARIKTSLACTFRALSSFPLHSLNGRRRKEDLKVLLEEQRWPQFNKDSFVCTYTIIFTRCWRKTR